MHKSSPYPILPGLHLLLILLSTVQVSLLLSSEIYLNGDLIRAFLQLYVDRDVYPEVFSGLSFYIQMDNIKELQKNLLFIFQQINNAQAESFLKLDYKDADILLELSYSANYLQTPLPVSIPIDPEVGIVEPFQPKNATSLQIALLMMTSFHIKINNLAANNDGKKEKYNHKISYHFQEGDQITVNFAFEIQGAMSGGEKAGTAQFLALKLFYSIVMIIAILSLYFNFGFVRRTLKQLYTFLHQKQVKSRSQFGSSLNLASHQSLYDQLPREQANQLKSHVTQYIEMHNLSLPTLTLRQRLGIFQLDTIFGILASIFIVVGTAFLLAGTEVTALIGVSCLLAWMTVFKILKKYPRLIMMYDLIKMSMVEVVYFLGSFSIIFMSYTLLGMCIFPKSRFFCSLSKSVTTLISMMLGDSIEMITSQLKVKYSTIVSIIYIFSYVILFMHAIHNTLTSLIKEFFILQKIDLIKKEKKDENQVWIEQIRTETEQKKRNLPLKMTASLQIQLLRMKGMLPMKQYVERIRELLTLLEQTLVKEKWEAFDCGLEFEDFLAQELITRSGKIKDLVSWMAKKNVEKYNENGEQNEKRSNGESQITEND